MIAPVPIFNNSTSACPDPGHPPAWAHCALSRRSAVQIVMESRKRKRDAALAAVGALRAAAVRRRNDVALRARGRPMPECHSIRKDRILIVAPHVSFAAHNVT